MNCKVEKTENANEVKLEITIEAEKFENAKIRVEVDNSDERIGYKIRKAQLEKVPYMAVIGDKEIEANAVGLRTRKDGDVGQISLEEFAKKIQNDVGNFQ